MPLTLGLDGQTVLGSHRFGVGRLLLIPRIFSSGSSRQSGIGLVDTDYKLRMIFLRGGQNPKVDTFPNFITPTTGIQIGDQTGGGTNGFAGTTPPERIAGIVTSSLTVFGSNRVSNCLLSINSANRSCIQLVAQTEAARCLYPRTNGILDQNTVANFKNLGTSGTSVGGGGVASGDLVSTLDLTEENLTIIRSDESYCSVFVLSKPGSASGLALLDANNVEYILWFRNDGILMIGSYAQFLTPNTAGTAVGDQA